MMFKRRRPGIEVFVPDKTTAGLIEVLRDPRYDRHIRLDAIWALAESGDVRALEPLRTALEDQEFSVRLAAVSVLPMFGHASHQLLCEALSSHDRHVRASAASALVVRSESRAVAPLCDALNDPDTGVRAAAAGTLGEIGDTGAVVPLRAALGDRSRKVRKAAGAALVKMGHSRSHG